MIFVHIFMFAHIDILKKMCYNIFVSERCEQVEMEETKMINTKVLDEKTVKDMIEENNLNIGVFINYEIPKRLNLTTKNITFGQWCEGVTLLRTEIYPKSYELMERLRNAGFDVKINMQSYELSYHGKL